MGNSPTLDPRGEVLAYGMNEKQMTEQGRRAAEAVGQTAQDLTEQATDTAKEWKDKARGAAQEWTDKAKGTAREWTDRARGQAREARVAADSYVHENAWTSIAMVAVVACVVGYLLGSSRDD